MASTGTDFRAVLEAHHDARKGMTRALAAEQKTSPREEAAIHQSSTTPVRAIRN